MGPLYGVTRPRFSYFELFAAGGMMAAVDALGWGWWVIPAYAVYLALCLVNDGVFKSKLGGGNG